MERELEALAARPARPAEPPFQALVEAAGGCGQVLLVGELWEREQSRALLWDFARAVFPPQQAAGKPGGATAEGAGPGAPGAQKVPETRARAIRSPLVFVLCRASSLAAREPRRHLREMLRDVRSRRRPGAALVGVLVAEAEPEDAVAPELRLLEALLRTVFGRQAGGPVQAAAYCPGHAASSLTVQAAACRALQAAGPLRPGERARGPGRRGRAAAGERPAFLASAPLMVHRGKLRLGERRRLALGLPGRAERALGNGPSLSREDPAWDPECLGKTRGQAEGRGGWWKEGWTELGKDLELGGRGRRRRESLGMHQFQGGRRIELGLGGYPVPGASRTRTARDALETRP